MSSSIERVAFWRQVIERLDQLSNRIPAEDRQRIIASIAQKAARPTPDEVEQVDRQYRAALAAFEGAVRLRQAAAR